ncbi:hypothetical protein ACQKP0_13945 [Heyndrickxia sp. NPDC080065]|uniref:hypothetical protein n=1 Tax=Heyndrickxia sp. NPDC080065 TaxID=3390568 RepID=UPI003D06FB48
MHKKKYLLLIPPALVIYIVLILTVSAEKRPYIIFIPIVAWCLYYIWIYIEKKKNRKNSD